MIKRIRKAVLAAAVLALIAFPCTAFAEHQDGASTWSVTFTSDAHMTDNYSSKEWADDLSKLEPGDDTTFEVTLNHEHSTTCDWYMSNEVLKSLEEGVAEGSAYEYVLTYYDPDGKSRTLFDSNRIGGTDSEEGLKEATKALDEFFYLDSLAKGQTARVTLNVKLDGETEGNAYFDTLAQLKMKFAVELNEKSTNGAPDNPNRNVVRTGDDTQLFPFYVAMAVSGALLLALGFASLRSRRNERKGGAHEAA